MKKDNEQTCVNLYNIFHDPFYFHNPDGFTSSLDDVVITLRSGGCSSTLDEIKSLYFSSKEFLNFAEDLYSSSSIRDEITEAIMSLNKFYDKPTTEFLFKNLLCKVGEKLDQNFDLEEFTKEKEFSSLFSLVNDEQLPPLPSLREIIRVYGLRAQKQLSQNFLLQPASINGLVKCAGNLRDAYVLEVGPGPGGLTRAILQSCPRHLVVVELDRRFLPGLQELRLAALEMGTKMDIYRQDILKFNCENIFPINTVTGPGSWNEMIEIENFHKISNKYDIASDNNSLMEIRHPKVCVIGNLPFNISTPLISQWLHDIAEKRGLWRLGRIPLILTFQKEVGQRLAADIWNDQRSRLSILSQTYCNVEYIKDIPNTAFSPVPKVDAAVIRLTPLVQPIISVPFPFVEKLVRQAFQFRNKQLVRCLETLFPSNRPDLVIQLFKEAGVQPVKRPTQVTLLEFRDLCIVYHRICQLNTSLFDFDYQSHSNVALWHKRKSIQRDILGSNTRLTADYVRQKMYM